MADILIPFYGKYEILIRCLQSLFDAMGHRNRIILIDDGSAPRERLAVDCFLKSFGRAAEVITHVENRGYREAICTGFLKCDQDHAILLNSDTVVSSDFDLLLVAVLEGNPSIRAAGPVSNHPTDLYQYREALRDAAPPVAANLCPNRAFLPYGDQNITLTPYLTGMCLAVDRQTFLDAGMFDKAYLHGYFEDLAFSCRLRSMGYHLAIREDCFVYHEGHATYREKSKNDKFEIISHNLRVFESTWGNLPEHSDLLAKMRYAGRVAPF
jgi:GT2 family glycosyltransferase